MTKTCIYCQKEVITDEQSGYAYAIEEDETISAAHLECIEMYDGLTITEPVKWSGYDG